VGVKEKIVSQRRFPPGKTALAESIRFAVTGEMLSMRDWFSKGKTGVAKRNTAPACDRGRHLLLKGGRDMLRLNMSFNLAIHLPLRWIAVLLYRFK
jgi:hypothetical protein